MHSTNLAWMTRNRSLGVSKIPIIMIRPLSLNFWIRVKNWPVFSSFLWLTWLFEIPTGPNPTFYYPTELFARPLYHYNWNVGVFEIFCWKIATHFFSSSKKYSISNHLVQWTFNSCKSVFSRAQFKKNISLKKSFGRGVQIRISRPRSPQPARLGLFAWHFGASFRAGEKPFAFSQWLTANYVKPLI